MRMAGAVLTGMALLALVFLRISVTVLNNLHEGPGLYDPLHITDVASKLDVLLLYGSVLAGLALMFWPKRLRR